MRRTAIAAALLLIASAVVMVKAAPTEASILSCSPATVTPGNNITCTVSARDGLQEPTSITNAGAFIIRVTADTQGSIPSVSPLTLTADPTVAYFTISTNQGTRLVVDVTATNGRPIRGSAFQALMYSWPPVFLGPLTCDKASLTLRDTTTCSVSAIGSNGIPAVVTPADVYLSEDHGDGTFTMISGTGNFVFSFSAPNFPSMKYPAFVVRIVLTGAVGDPRNVTLPLQFPTLQPNVVTTLRCTDTDFSLCVVNAANDGGPVQFNPSDYVVTFDQDTSGIVNAPAWQATPSLMYATWTAANSAQMNSIGNLLADQVVRNAVLRIRMHVTLAATGQEISGSPHVFLSGIAPQASDLTVQKCTRSFILTGTTTTCYLAVAPTASAAARFVSVAIVSGSGTVTPPEYVNGTLTSVDVLRGQRAIRFNFTAPANLPGDRLDAMISVSVQGQDIVRSPTRIVVFPRNGGGEGVVAVNRKPVIALGLCYFGAAFTLGLFAFFRRQSRLARVKMHRREKEMMATEMEEKLKVHTRPLSPVEKKEIKAQLSAFAKANAADDRTE